jgi:hypothetical protein
MYRLVEKKFFFSISICLQPNLDLMVRLELRSINQQTAINKTKQKNYIVFIALKEFK